MVPRPTWRHSYTDIKLGGDMGRSPIRNVRIVTQSSESSELGYRFKCENLDTVTYGLSYRCDNDIVLSHHHLRFPPLLYVYSNVDIKLPFSCNHQKWHVFTLVIVS